MPAMRRAETRPRRPRIGPGRPVLRCGDGVCEKHVIMVDGEWVCKKCQRAAGKGITSDEGGGAQVTTPLPLGLAPYISPTILLNGPDGN